MPAFRTAALLAALTAAGALTAAPPAAAASCSTTWGSKDKTAGTLSRATIQDLRAGRHACFDRLVVDLDGKVALAQYNVKATGHVAKLRRDLGLAS